MRIKKDKIKARYIFATSVAIAILKKESGYKQAEDLLASSCISTVNFSEFITVMLRKHIALEDAKFITRDFFPYIIEFNQEIAEITGALYNETNKFGLSLGDRACIATGMKHDLEIYTADKAWLECEIPNANIKLIR